LYTDRKFRKSERLHLKNDIDSLFRKGAVAKKYPLIAKYNVVDDSESLIRLLVSVPKKRVRKASDRNRLKRSIKESYRLLKPGFSGLELPNNKGLHVALILTADSSTENQKIKESVSTVFNDIFEKIKK
jgi:ribonuclease P protein component